MMCSPLALLAQIGDYRNGLAIGFNGGYVLSNIGFNPNGSQTFHNGMSGGLTIRYVSKPSAPFREKSISHRPDGRKTS